MTNQENLNGRFKAELYFNINKATMTEIMTELDMPNSETLIETIRSYLTNELSWLADSGFYDCSVGCVTLENIVI